MMRKPLVFDVDRDGGDDEDDDDGGNEDDDDDDNDDDDDDDDDIQQRFSAGGSDLTPRRIRSKPQANEFRNQPVNSIRTRPLDQIRTQPAQIRSTWSRYFLFFFLYSAHRSDQ